MKMYTDATCSKVRIPNKTPPTRPTFRRRSLRTSNARSRENPRRCFLLSGAIAVEDGSPLFEGFVGGKDDRTAFVALADGLEEQVGSALIDGKIADLVEEQ